MTNILYKAADGTEIPGYLTVPSRRERKNLPLIVMPHDGPAARDSWKFSFLRTFLANRGYAVLQMNYRGSAGFGAEMAARRESGLGRAHLLRYPGRHALGGQRRHRRPETDLHHGLGIRRL